MNNSLQILKLQGVSGNSRPFAWDESTAMILNYFYVQPFFDFYSLDIYL